MTWGDTCACITQPSLPDETRCNQPLLVNYTHSAALITMTCPVHMPDITFEMAKHFRNDVQNEVYVTYSLVQK